MQADIERVLIDRQAIADRVRSLADQITRDHCGDWRDEPGESGRPGQPQNADVPDITLVPILTGSFIFVADLIRHLPVMVKIGLLSISSYAGTATSSRGTTIREELTHLPSSLGGKHVLLVDDILDSGQTLKLAVEILAERNPASLRTCVLLRKRRPEALAFDADYVAFDIPDEFVVGYGLDFNDYYRNLPDIVTLKQDVVEAAQQDESIH